MHFSSKNSLYSPQTIKEFIRIDVDVYIVFCDGEFFFKAQHPGISDDTCTLSTRGD